MESSFTSSQHGTSIILNLCFACIRRLSTAKDGNSNERPAWTLLSDLRCNIFSLVHFCSHEQSEDDKKKEI